MIATDIVTLRAMAWPGGISVAHRVERATRNRWSDLLEFCYPSRCAGCDEASPSAAPLCASCLVNLSHLEEHPACPRCALPLPTAATPCGRCNGKGLRPFGKVVRGVDFESTARSMVHAVKYRKQWNVGAFLAKRLARTERADELLQRVDVIVPVPLHWWRQFLRGFNQAEVVARTLAKPHGLPVRRAVSRTRHTPSQTAFDSRAARARNVRECFHLDRPDWVQGRRVLVVDDVMTTGATLRAMAVCLGEANPESIHAMVLASVSPTRSSVAPVKLK